MIHPSLTKRKIIHVDMDSFYASVEILDNPSLKGKPVIVGGPPNSRGVVATCSYEARKFGIHSAMASSRAFKLCPQAIFVRGNFCRYKEVSLQIREIFNRFTTLVEPLSLDEAYLDVTGHELYATQIAKKIKDSIQKEIGLTASAGVAPNKLIAKIASDLNKPNGLTVIQPHQVEEFMKNLALRKINGIGEATEKKLLQYHFKICSDIWPYSEEELKEKLGERLGSSLYKRTRGIDEEPLHTIWVRKSLGTETTFAEDLLDREKIKEELIKLSEQVAESLKKKNLAGKTITLKVKYSDFKRITRAKTIEQMTNQSSIISHSAYELLLKTLAGEKPIRLLGLSVSRFEDKTQDTSQLSLIDLLQ